MTQMPTDTLGNPIPALGYVDGGAKTVALTVTSARNSTAISASTRVITLYATVACYLRFGDSTVTANNTDHFFPSGTYYDVAIGPDTKDRYVAAIRDGTTDGTLYISERQ